MTDPTDELTEADTLVSLPYLGQLTYREWHALVDGVYCGYVGERANEYSTEKHYWRAGYLIGDAYDRVTSD